DLAGVAHLSAIKTRIPFLHFFDGFRTSAEVQKIEVIEMDDMKKLVDWEALEKFRNNALNPEHPVTRGTNQNPDIFFQAKEAINKFYEPIPDVVNAYMAEITKITGREYKPFTYYGSPDAENIIVAMGSITDTTKEVIDYLNAKGEKAGLLTVHLYRPFSDKYFFNVLPKSVKKITVLDRTKEPGAPGDPLYLDVKNMFYTRSEKPVILGGRYGLSSKDTTPAMVLSIFENMKLKEPKDFFTVGITDDVTFKSLPESPEINVALPGTHSAKFYGLGSDGTVGANKNSIKIIGDTTDKYCQAYFAYDSKKSGGITISHLRFGDNPIRSPYYVNTPDFVACHVPSYIDKYDNMLKGLKKNGIFLFNSLWDAEETKKRLPDSMKKYMAENNINFYIINATAIAEEIGLGNRTNTIMQAAFFRLANIIPYDKAEKEMKKAIYKTYGRKGEDVVNMNYAAVDRGGQVEKVEIPAEWAGIKVEKVKENGNKPEFYRNVVDPIIGLKGDEVPVSAFIGREDGTFPAGISAYEKRGIAVNVPEWQPDECIQCNQCSYVCPHAAIRPFLLTDEEAKNAPEGTKTIQGIPGVLKQYRFRMQLSVYDCTGCGNCADICPSKNKALIMKPLGTQLAEADRWTYMHEKVGYKDSL
ncbi:MAG: pyruvate:ferredoxin (flavodoxin) oxidoreductase, partial [Bacteroidales bacterium]|nr:pyruvate:ferredoxin (flavodoxin) oxidoreductase [Bacteroidales bacterium]